MKSFSAAEFVSSDPAQACSPCLLLCPARAHPRSSRRPHPSFARCQAFAADHHRSDLSLSMVSSVAHRAKASDAHCNCVLKREPTSLRSTTRWTTGIEMIWTGDHGLARSDSLRGIISSPLHANSSRLYRTVVELDIGGKELIQHVVWDRLVLDVLEEGSHRGSIREVAILLVEPKVRRMKVHDQGRRLSFELP